MHRTDTSPLRLKHKVQNSLDDQHDKQHQRPQQETESAPVVSVTSGGGIVGTIERSEAATLATGDVVGQGIEQRVLRADFTSEGVSDGLSGGDAGGKVGEIGVVGEGGALGGKGGAGGGWRFG